MHWISTIRWHTNTQVLTSHRTSEPQLFWSLLSNCVCSIHNNQLIITEMSNFLFEMANPKRVPVGMRCIHRAHVQYWWQCRRAEFEIDHLIFANSLNQLEFFNDSNIFPMGSFSPVMNWLSKNRWIECWLWSNRKKSWKLVSRYSIERRMQFMLRPKWCCLQGASYG